MTAQPPPPPRTVLRFSRGVRAVHWAVAVLVVVLVLTAAVLYNGSLSVLVGHRHAVELLHVYAGLVLPVPFLLGLLSRAFRADLGRLNRFVPADWRWLRSRNRRDGTIRVGKFNAGQKLNAALTAGSIVVLLGTGVLMYFTGLVGLPLRTGATFVHDWFALGLGLLVLGHVYFALKDRQALRGMRTGRVATRWAIGEHAAWAAELTGETDDAPAPSPRGGGGPGGAGRVSSVADTAASSAFKTGGPTHGHASAGTVNSGAGAGPPERDRCRSGGLRRRGRR